MKIIDLLNKIANGEEVPEKIKYDNDIYEYREENREGICYVEEDTYNNFLIDYVDSLNDEIEILEEDKKIEKVAICDDHIMWEYGELYNPTKNEEILRNKINEIIDGLNKEKE